MSDDGHIILGIHVTERLKNAVQVQKVFSEFGCNIKTRIGLHDVDDRSCSPSGVVLIEFFGTSSEADVMIAKLNEVEGVEVKQMVFGHDA
jgi:ACT domain-containing protein